MMETTDNKFKFRLGLFVACGLAIALGVIFFIGKQKNLFNTTFQMKAMFKNIGGLQVGNHVRFSGINVGVIDDISIVTDTTVQITMIIDQSVKKFMKQDAIATIGSEGLMGDKVINISHGSNTAPAVKHDFIVESTEPIETEEIMMTLQNTGQNAEVITDQLAEILYKVNNGDGTLSRLIRDTSIAENLNQTIINLKAGTNNLNQNMEAAKKSILFRGYFKRKEREKEEKKEEEQKKQNEKKDDKKDDKKEEKK